MLQPLSQGSHQVACVSDIHITVYNGSKFIVVKFQQIEFVVGSPHEDPLKDRSIGKVEKHCCRQLLVPSPYPWPQLMALLLRWEGQ